MAAPQITVRNPADCRQVVGRVPAMTTSQALEALERAAAARGQWHDLGPIARGQILRRAADLLREREATLAGLITAEMGKTSALAEGEVRAAADFLDFYAGLGRAPLGEVLPDAREGVTATVVREPLGLVFVITPWNDPLVTPCRKLGPALISGNTAVLKPSSEAPLICLALVEVLVESGLSVGVVEVVTGHASEVVTPVLDDPRIAGVTFTGSTQVGMALRARLATSTARLQTEMGGKNAAVVMADADLDLAVSMIVASGIGQSGQRCTATSRVLVHRGVLDAFKQRLTSEVEALRVGHGDANGVDVGPLITEAAMTGIIEDVEAALTSGAKPLAGGRRCGVAGMEHGWFLEPTILEGVEPGMEIWRKELFGPVLTITAFDTLDEAIALVNDSYYGLSAAIYTRSLHDASLFARLAEAGQVAVNLGTSGWPAQLPFGGFGQSGSAHKEQGRSAVDFYTRLKTTAVSIARRDASK